MTIPEATPVEVYQSLQRGDGLLVDVREPWEYEQQRIDGAVLIPLTELPGRIIEVPSDRDVYVACRMGSRSARAVEFLHEAGRPRARNLLGGLEAWIEAGLPVGGEVSAR